jgi:2-keto-4-pentenoate hydratase
MEHVPSSDALARLLVEARRDGHAIANPDDPLAPRDAADAYAVQLRSIALRGSRTVAWKVGAKSADGPIQGSALPSDAFRTSPGTLRRADYGVLGLELEIAFRLGRSFAPAASPYPDDEVLASIASMATAIEAVSSRFAAWPKVAPLLQLADLQNHGALCVGPAVPYDASYPFEQPAARFDFNGSSVLVATPRNPAGDPRRLLPWLVNHVTSHGGTFGDDIWVTTGSYTGMHFPETAGTAIGKFERLPEIRLTVDARQAGMRSDAKETT